MIFRLFIAGILFASLSFGQNYYNSNLDPSDVTKGDCSNSAHGFTPKAPNDSSKFLRGDGCTWAVPSGSPIITPSSDSTTAVQITKADGTTAIFIVDTTNSQMGVNVTPAAALDVLALATSVGLNVAGTAPAGVSSGNGMNASSILVLTGPNGGATSDSSTIRRGGIGSSITFTAGAGGENSGTNGTSNINNRAGLGGSINFQPGPGGASTGGSGATRAGPAGAINISGAKGGNTSQATNAGRGSDVIVASGYGGDGENGSGGNGGAAGDISFIAGEGGIGEGAGVNGPGGSVAFDAGAGNPNGTISFGPNNASSIAIGRSGIATTINGSEIVAEAVTFSGLTAASGTPNSICQNSGTKEITVNTALTCTVSSRDYKTNISPLPDAADSRLLMHLMPAQFAYLDSPDRVRWGFVAEEVATVDPKLADGYDAKGVARSLDQNAILALIVKAIQEQQRKIDALKIALNTLQSR